MACCRTARCMFVLVCTKKTPVCTPKNPFLYLKTPVFVPAKSHFCPPPPKPPPGGGLVRFGKVRRGGRAVIFFGTKTFFFFTETGGFSSKNGGFWGQKRVFLGEVSHVSAASTSPPLWPLPPHTRPCCSRPQYDPTEMACQQLEKYPGSALLFDRLHDAVKEWELKEFLRAFTGHFTLLWHSPTVCVAVFQTAQAREDAQQALRRQGCPHEARPFSAAQNAGLLAAIVERRRPPPAPRPVPAPAHPQAQAPRAPPAPSGSVELSPFEVARGKSKRKKQEVWEAPHQAPAGAAGPRASAPVPPPVPQASASEPLEGLDELRDFLEGDNGWMEDFSD